MTREKSAQMHAAKERKRMAGPSPEYPPEIDYAAPIESWRIRRFVTGKIYDIVLFPSRRRRDTFRVVVNGKNWKNSIGYDRLMRQTVKSLSKKSNDNA